MKPRRLVHVIVAALALVAPCVAGEPIVTTDLLRVRSVTSIDVARDGSFAVYAVRSIGDGPRASEDELARPVNQSHLFRLDLRSPNATPRRLSHGNRMDVAPVIAPDGRTIAFVRSPRDDDETTPPQIWVMPVDGGEARQVTALSRGASAPRWSPDGRTILFSSRVSADDLPGRPPWPEGRPGRPRDAAPPDPEAAGRPAGTREEIRAWLAANERESNPVVLTRLNFQDETELRTELTFRHLFLVDVDEGAEPRRITSLFRDHENAAFASDGRSVYFAGKAVSVRHPDYVLDKGIWRIDVAGGGEEEMLAIEGWSLDAPQPSRDGSVIAFVGRQMDVPAFRQRRLGVLALGGGAAGAPAEPIWLTDDNTFDASVRRVAWMPTQSSLLFTTAVHGGFPLMTMGVGLLDPVPVVQEMDGAPIGVHAFAAGGGAIVYAVTSSGNPCVLRVLDARGDRLGHDLNAWVADKTLSTPEPGWITRPDGVRVQYWLMEPTDREPGATYPLAVEIHGGPSAMWGPGEFTMWHEMQLLCSWGYAVVYCNPRGSDGYGYEMLKGNYQNWGQGPSGDVLAVVDKVMLEEWIDPERMVVTGGSYGGYLTAWIVAYDHRFRAAVAQRGVYDLATFYGEGNAWRLVEWAMGGVPSDPRVTPIIRRESPYNVVNRIRTPLLIMHASNDLRTGVSQSEMLFRALKRLGRPVEYVRYPDAGHDLSRTGDPRQRMDRLNRMIDFFERRVENPRPAP